ncbi:MAG: hypothetical protein V3V37_03985, partial [Candidatus Adiutricales bacterium]
MPLIDRSTGIDYSGLPPIDDKPLKIPPGVTFDPQKLDNTLIFSDTLKLKPSFVYNNHDLLNGQLKKRSQAFA